MPIGMEAILDDVAIQSITITGEGFASWQGPGNSADDLPAVIAIRLRWHRRFLKDRTLDYDEGTLGPGTSFSGHLKVHYTLSNGETKKVFVEMINRRTGQKVHSERRTFTGVNVI